MHVELWRRTEGRNLENKGGERLSGMRARAEEGKRMRNGKFLMTFSQFLANFQKSKAKNVDYLPF